MPDVFVDPVIVMTPGDNATKDEVVAWLDNLNTWLKEALSSPYEWLHSIEATNLLEGNGKFPSFATLRDLQKKFRLDISLPQLRRKIDEFFRDEERDLASKLKQ